MDTGKMICMGCDNDAFEEEDGFFYCLQCGVRADNIIATAVDDQDFAGDNGGTRGATYSQVNARRITTQPTPTPSHPEETNQYSQFRSQLKKSATKISSQPKSAAGDELGAPTDPEDFGGEDEAVTALSYEDCYQQTRERYANGLIMMITYQCDALVEKFNVTPLIIGLVGPICLRFLALSGAFDQDWADNAIRDSELQSQETNGEVREVKKRRKGDSQHRSFDGKRAVTIWLSQLRSSLPLSSSLAISFLACHKAGAPVLPTDIVRWAREGKLPYQSCFLKIQELMGERTAACPVGASVMFRPEEIVSAHNLETQAASIADVIGLVLPPVNFHGIALNYLKRLCVPVDKVMDLVRLWGMPSEIYLSKSQHRLPTRVCVMSVLVVAIRMLYNINGFGMWEKSLVGDDDDDDDEEESGGDDDGELMQVEKVATEFDTVELMKTLERRYYEVVAETTADFENDLSSYLSHGKNEIFAGVEAASADDTYRTVSKLWNSYQKEEEESETPSKRGRDSPCEPSLECSPSPDDHTQEDSRSKEREKIVDDHTQEDSRSKEREISRLIADMGENYFVYIPPRVKVKRQGYIQYVRKKDDGALVYAVHADYYILLRVCARVAEIDARNMHRGVLSFERRLAWIEKRIDHVLHLTPTSSSVKCKHCDDGNVDSEDHDDDMVEV